MKFFTTLSIMLITFTASTSLACFYFDDRKVCSGDKVAVKDPRAGYYDYETGIIISMNPVKRQITVNIDGFSNHYEYPIEKVAFDNACIIKVCTGDEVSVEDPRNGYSDMETGKIIGVNPYEESVVVDISGFSNHYSYHISKVSQDNCFRRLCTGDKVSVKDPRQGYIDYEVGYVIGINPYEKTVSVNLYGFSNHYQYHIRDVARARGCTMYVCVGDKVTAKDPRKGYNDMETGKVIAVNRRTRTVVVDLDGFSRHYKYNAEDVSIVSMNDDYDYDERDRSIEN